MPSMPLQGDGWFALVPGDRDDPGVALHVIGTSKQQEVYALKRTAPRKAVQRVRDCVN